MIIKNLRRQFYNIADSDRIRMLGNRAFINKHVPVTYKMTGDASGNDKTRPKNNIIKTFFKRINKGISGRMFFVAKSFTEISCKHLLPKTVYKFYFLFFSKLNSEFRVTGSR